MTLRDRIFFTRYFAILLHAGLTITQALHIIQDQLTTAEWKIVLHRLAKAVQSGNNLADSLKEMPKQFPPFYAKMIAVGEESGNLAEVFSYLEKQMEKDYALISKVKRAFIYPVVILSILLSVSVGLLIFIVPKVARLFTQLNIELPLPTRMLLGTQALFTRHGILILLILMTLFVVFQVVKKIPSIKRILDTITLRIPVIGVITKNLNIARFSHILFTLLASGVPLVQALHIASDTLSNVIYRKAVSSCAHTVSQGESLGDSIGKFPRLFPKLIANMIRIGEKTGNLQEQMHELAAFFAAEVGNSVKTLSVIIEPLLLVVVAGGVGSVALSIVLPLYQLPNLLNR